MQNERVIKETDAVPRHIDEPVIAAAAQRGEIIRQVSPVAGEIAMRTVEPTRNITNEQEVHFGQGDYIIA